MLPDLHRTIVALASGAQGSPRAIVRLAGPATARILRDLCTEDHADCAHLRGFLTAKSLSWCESQAFLPALCRWLPLSLLYWPDERSYTGCPAAELHLIGSLPLAQAVIERCCELGAQVAERGEFTLRAFLAGKLDLAQAEAVLGVIQADSPDTLASALAQLGGNLAPAVAPLRETLIGVLAELEAGLDFVDEDIQFIDPAELLNQLADVLQQLTSFSTRLQSRSSTSVAPQVVLAGLPNSGKSTLFNALSGRDLAIVADIPGTTRDYLQERIQVGEVSFDLIDTAGWESLLDDSPRALAQQQLTKCLSQAHVTVVCIDLSRWSEVDLVCRQLVERGEAAKSWLLVGTKSDQVSLEGERALRQASLLLGIDSDQCPKVSQQKLDSVNLLRERIVRLLIESRQGQVLDPLALVHETAVRCRAAMAAAVQSLTTAIDLVIARDGDELVAAELRQVVDELSSIIGEVHSDDVLGEIFSRFCIGK